VINILVILPLESYTYFMERVDEIMLQSRVITFPGVNSTLDILNNYKYLNRIDNENPSYIIEKIDYKDNKYIIHISTLKENVNLGIKIPEQYHGGWIAFIKKDQKILSTPHMFVNNFWMRFKDKGLYKIEIEFTPQNTWRIIYILNALTTISILLSSFLYLISLNKRSGRPFPSNYT